MATPLQTPLDDISNILKSPKATMAGQAAKTTSPTGDAQAESNLPAAQQAAQGAVEASQAAEAEVVTADWPTGAACRVAAPQKLVAVPVRKRSARWAGAGLGQPAVGTAGAGLQGFRQVPLPATPPPAVDDTQPTASPDLPATTPLAAEVLAGLGLGALAVAAEEEAQNHTPQPTPLRVLSGGGGGSSSSADGAHSSDSAAGSMLAMPASAGAPAERAESRPASAGVLPRAAATAAALSLAAAGPTFRPKAGSSQEPRKGCNCKRSMCLKMYCECFAAGGYCAPGCACANCYNHQAEAEAVKQARQIVLAKDARAFEKKVSATEGHKRGCRCKRSKCQKKYCECFHAGAKCNPDVCQCEGCKNTDDSGVEAFPSSLLLPDDEAPPQAPAVLPALRMLAGAAPQQRDMPEASLVGGKEDSYGDSHGLVAAQQGPAVGGVRASAQQQAAAAGAAQHLAFAGFQLASLQQSMAEGAGALPLGPFMLGPASAMMPGLFMPPFVFNPMAAAAAFSAGQPQLQPVLLPIAPLTTMAAAPPAVPGPAAKEATGSHGNAASLPGASGNDAQLATQRVAVAAAEAAAVTAEVGQLPPVGAAAGAATSMGGEGDAASAPGVQYNHHQQQQQPGSVALTAHLSEVLGTMDPDIRDTATSPAPHVAVSRLPGAKLAAAATLTARRAPPAQDAAAGGGQVPRAACEENSLASAWPSGNASGGSTLASGAGTDSLQRSKRPRRAASSGVVGAVAAEAAAWSGDWTSPPKRASSLPAGGGVGNRAKAAGRFALLRKALEAETHAQKRAKGCILAPRDCNAGSVAAEEEDVISALFELSSSVC